MSSTPPTSAGCSLLYSPLYCRYNGFLFGLFFMHVFLEYQNELYEMQRTRMMRFLEEIDISLDLPSTHEGFRTSHYSLSTEILRAFAASSRSLFNHTVLGMTAAGAVVLSRLDERNKDTISRIIREEELDLAFSDFERVPDSLRGD